MFDLDFTRRYPARLRFDNEPDPNAGGGNTPPAAASGEQGEHGFPAGTALDAMTVEQREAYWKFHSRKHESATEAARRDLAARDARITELEHAQLGESERAIAEARNAGRAEGANRYLVDAVTARLQHLTGKSDEDIAAAIDLLDVSKLTTADGTIDIPKLTSFAATLGGTPKQPAAPAGTPPFDAVRAAMERAGNDPAHRGGGSIKELTKQRLAELTPTK